MVSSTFLTFSSIGSSISSPAIFGTLFVQQYVEMTDPSPSIVSSASYLDAPSAPLHALELTTQNRFLFHDPFGSTLL